MGRRTTRCPAEADVVVANIALKPVVALGRRLDPAARSSGIAGGDGRSPRHVIVAGLLEDQVDEALTAWPAFVERERRSDGEWVAACAVGTPPPVGSPQAGPLSGAGLDRVGRVQGQPRRRRVAPGRRRRGGHEAADGPAPADVAVVTTCCVTAEAERSSRQRVRRLRARGLSVVVTGCAVVYRPEQFDHPLMTVVLGRPGREAVGSPRPDAAAGRRVSVDRARARRCRTPSGWRPHRDSAMAADGPAEPIATVAGHVRRRTRTVLKVQDGCDGSCAYCAVRLVRGGPWSLPPGQALSDARSALAAGCGEVVVSGINLGLYGRRLGVEGADRRAGAGRSGRPSRLYWWRCRGWSVCDCRRWNRST